MTNVNHVNKKIPAMLAGANGDSWMGAQETQRADSLTPNIIITEGMPGVNPPAFPDVSAPPESEELMDYEGGFYAEGVASPRVPVNWNEAFEAACLADPEITAKTDFYLSMFTYPNAFLKEVDRTGKTANYQGSTGGSPSGSYLCFDFDRPGDLAAAVKDMLTLVDDLCTLEDSAGTRLSPENFILTFSGAKGLHLMVPLTLCAHPVPSDDFARICRTMAEALAEKARIVIDSSVFDRVRLFRGMNSIHGKSGLYKIPVSYRELKESTVSMLVERAKRPRRLIRMDGVVQPEGDDVLFVLPVNVVPTLKSLWDECAAKVSNSQGSNPSFSSRRQGNYFSTPSSGLRQTTQDFLQHGAPEGERAMGLFKAAADCYRSGMPEEKIKSDLTEVALRTGLTMNEITHQIQCGIDNQKQQDAQKPHDGYAPCTTSQDFAASYISQLPGLSLVHSAGEWFGYRLGYGWRIISESTVKANVTNFICQTAEQQTFGGKKMNVDRWLIQSVMDCVQAKLMVIPPDEDKLDPTVWLRFDNGCISTESAEGWIATRSHLIHVPTVARMLHRGLPIPENAIRPVNSSLFAIGMVPVSFDVNALCPRWHTFVYDEACPGDAEMLQMMFGLSLTYDRKYNVAFTVHGPAGSGKSSGLSILAALSANSVCGVSLSALGERFQTFPLTINRLNLLPDCDSVFEGTGSVSLREAVLKSLTCGEKIMVERKHKPPEYRYLCTLSVWGCNTLPRFADRSDAISNRMRVISFPNVFRGKEQQDISLGDKLHAELSGILIWALKGYGALLDSGIKTFPETPASAALKQDAIKESRPEELFCDEMLESSPGANLPTEAAYLHYVDYCKARGYKPFALNNFVKEVMRCMKVTKKRKQLSGYEKPKSVFEDIRYMGVCPDNRAACAHRQL